MEETRIELDFSTELSPSFLITCIDKVIKLKNPIFKKISYEEEPKDILIEVNSKGIKEIKSSKGILSIIVPLDVIIMKKMNFLGEKRIEFSIEFEHSFIIELSNDCKISLISKSTNFSWKKVPNVTILSIEFNITNYIEPKLKEHLDNMINESYKIISNYIQDEIKEILKKVSNSFSEGKVINGKTIQCYFIEIIFEKNFICTEEEEEDKIKVYGSIIIGLKELSELKKEINEMKFRINKIEKPKNMKVLNLITLGTLNDNHSATLKLYLKIPLKRIMNNIFSIGSTILNVKEGFVTMKAILNNEIEFLSKKITSNDISFDIKIPLYLNVIKLSVQRFCFIDVNFSFSFYFSEMGIDLKNCKGNFEWIEKPEDFSPFGIKLIDVEREIEDELKIKILKSQELIISTIHRAFQFIETDTNASFIYPQFLSTRNVLLNLSIGKNGRIGFLIEKHNTRYFSLSMRSNGVIGEDQNDQNDTLGLIIHYQMPISVKSSDVTITKMKEKWNESFSENGFIKDYF